MEKIDLFESLVRFLAIKPLKFEKFNLEQAKTIIKKERDGAITFLGDHGYFEEIIEETAKSVATSGVQNGTVYIYVKGDGCIERVKRQILLILLNVGKVIIFGDEGKWGFTDPKIQYTSAENIFEDNHQRFFVFQSPGYNTALVSRHGSKGIEAAITNASDAVDLLGQTIGLRIYQNN